MEEPPRIPPEIVHELMHLSTGRAGSDADRETGIFGPRENPIPHTFLASEPRWENVFPKDLQGLLTSLCTGVDTMGTIRKSRNGC